LLRLPLPLQQSESQTTGKTEGRPWKMNPFLLRFLPSMALWTAALACFMPFANVYLSKDLHIPLSQIGLIFSAAQVIQFCVGLLTPVLFRRLGLLRGRSHGLFGRHSRPKAGSSALPELFRGAMDERSGAVQPADEQGSGRGAQLGVGHDHVLQCAVSVLRYGGCGDPLCAIWIPSRAGGDCGAGADGGASLWVSGCACGSSRAAPELAGLRERAMLKRDSANAGSIAWALQNNPAP
jgi:hypothetical protein